MSTARRRSGVVAGVAVLAITLSGCGMFGGGSKTDATGVLSTKRAQDLAGASASATAGATGTPGAAATAGGPTLRPAPGATLPCDAKVLVAHIAAASGAVHGYIAKPGATAPKVLALSSSASRATAAKAADYAANQLRSGLTASAGCASTKALGSVTKQTSSYLSTLSVRLGKGTATAQQAAAAEALMADVTSQADRIGLTVKDKVPAATAFAN